MKRLHVLSILAVLTLVLCCILPTKAEAATEGYYTYEVSDGKATITDCNISISGDITIPATLGGYPVTSIGESAFEDCSSLTAITIPDSVTSIGGAAFIGCSSLTSITIPDSVTSIGYNAFRNCSSLTSITIPDSVTNIGSSAFYGCSSLTAITIPDSVTSIGNYTFSYCSSLIDVTIPESVTSIGDGAFSNCSSLTSITIPSGVTSIGDHAVYNCSSLATVNFNAINCTTMGSHGYRVFERCINLATVNIGSSVAKIPPYAFEDCSSLTSVTFDENSQLTSIGNFAFQWLENLTSITIPDSVTSIDSYAFYYCSGLSSITFSKNSQLTSVGSNAFYYCNSLTSIIIPDGVTSIDNYAFFGCSNLTSVSFGKNSQLTSIGDAALCGCSSLSSITIPDSVISIGRSAFEGCSSLTSITIPDSVTSIGESAFYGCSSLESMTLPFVGGSRKNASDTYQYPLGYIFGVSSYAGGVATKQQYYGPYNYTTTSTTYYIPGSLKSVTITDGEIPYGAFSNCGNLTDVAFSEGITRIGNRAFYNCSKLKEITIPGSVAAIGKDAFYGCSGLDRVSITDIAAWCEISFETADSTSCYANPLCYADNLYLNGTLVADVVIPDGATRIGDYAFRNYSNLTSIVIPESVTSIGTYAFNNCNKLTDITIPDSVTSIADYAFYYCTSLNYHTYDNANYLGNSKNPYIVLVSCVSADIASCTVHDDTKFIQSTAFRNCSSLTKVNFGKNNRLTSIGYKAFYNCAKLTELYFFGTQEQWEAIQIGAGNEALQNIQFVEQRNEQVSITKQPESIVANHQEDVALTVEAVGEGLKYQWYRQEPGSSTWVIFTSASSKTANFTFKAYDYNNGRAYKCIITDAEGNEVETDVVTLTVRMITKQPTSQYTAPGEKATFSVGYSITKGVTYQWQLKYASEPESKWRATSATGNKTNALTFSTTNMADRYMFRCVITDNDVQIISNEVSLWMVADPATVTSAPAGILDAVEGYYVFLRVKAEGTGMKYYWQASTDGGKTYYNCTSSVSANTADFRVIAYNYRQGYMYRCAITTPNASDQNVTYTDWVTLNILPGVEITQQPQSVAVAPGETATFTVKAQMPDCQIMEGTQQKGDGSVIVYHWQRSKSGTGNWTYISGAASDTLSITATEALDGYYYRCVVTNDSNQGTGYVASASARLTIGESNKQPLDTGKWTAKQVVRNCLFSIELDFQEMTFSVGYGEDVRTLDFGTPEEWQQWYEQGDQGVDLIDGVYYYSGSGDGGMITYTVIGDTVEINCDDYLFFTAERTAKDQLTIVKSSGARNMEGIVLTRCADEV